MLFYSAHVLRLYPSIPHNVELRALKEALNNKNIKNVFTEDLMQIAVLVL